MTANERGHKLMESSAECWAWFAGRFPNADQTKFIVKVVGYKNQQISDSQIYDKMGMITRLEVDGQNCAKEMNCALDLPVYRVKPSEMITKAAPVSEFLYQLSPRQTETSMPIPVVNFRGSTKP